MMIGESVKLRFVSNLHYVNTRGTCKWWGFDKKPRVKTIMNQMYQKSPPGDIINPTFPHYIILSANKILL